MKFSSLQHTSVKTFTVRNFDGGTDLSCIPSNIPDSSLSKSLNMWHKDGLLKTRPGLEASQENIIKSESGSYSETLSYTVADGGFYIGGEYKKIAVEEYCESDSHYFCRIFFIGTDGNSQSAGYFVFNRISNEDFYQPVNILFYSAKSVSGAGVFALAAAENKYNPGQKSYRVYELDESLASWTEHTDFYTPVVYINGRGTRYEEARDTGLAYTGQPKILEAQNLLTNSFKAYFTSDGHSSAFRLPFSGLNDDSVICRVYVGPSAYAEWTVLPGQASAETMFYTAQITLNVDREKGIIYFTDDSGDYPLPMISTYHENNVRVTAGKDVEGGIGRAASCTCCAAYGSKIVFSGGNDKAAVFSVPVSNPLYFSLGSAFSAGGPDKGVNALLSYGGGVLAFKDDEIYDISLKEGGALNSTSLLADDGSVFYEGDSFSAKRISAAVGCTNRHTALLCGKQPVWLGNDGRIYSLNLSSGEIKALSSEINRYFDGSGDFLPENAYAAVFERRYILMSGGKSVIIDYGSGKAENAAAYPWDFGGISLAGAVSGSGKLRFICVGSDGLTLYSAGLSSEGDTDICSADGESVTEKKAFSNFIATKCFNLGSMTRKKLIQSVFLSVRLSGELTISVNGGLPAVFAKDMPEYGCGQLKNVKLIPRLGGVNQLWLTLSSDNGFALCELTVYYRETV